jgi:hypothetical protein
MSRDAPIRHGKKVIYPNPKSLPQQNLWEFIQSNYFNNSIDEIDDKEPQVVITDSSYKNVISPNSLTVRSNNNRSPLSISPNSKVNPKSIISEIDEQNASPSKKYGKPEIVSRKLKKIVLPSKVITYKHRPRTKLTKASLQYHNSKFSTNDIGNNAIINIHNENDNVKSSDDYNGNIIYSATDTAIAEVVTNDVILDNTINHGQNSFDKSELMNLKRKIQNSPGRSVRSHLSGFNTDSVKASSTNSIKEDENTNIIPSDVILNDDSSDEDYGPNDALSIHLDDYHNLSESLEKSYIEEFPDQKGDPSLHFDNVELSEAKPNQNDLDKDVTEENNMVQLDSKENSLLKEQADELEEERRVRATLEARLQESRIMLQILAGQNLRTYPRRKSHQDIDALEKTIEGVGEVLSVNAAEIASPTIKSAVISPKPVRIRTGSSGTPPKVITSIRRANNNSTPVISISLSHLLGDIDESEPQTKSDIQDDPDIINSNSSKDDSQKIVDGHTNSSPITSDNDEPSSEKSKSGSIFNSLLSVFQRKKSEDLKKGDVDRLKLSTLK